MKVKAKEILHYYVGCMFKYTYQNGDIIYAYMSTINDTGFICGQVEWIEENGSFRKPNGDQESWFEINDIYKEGEIKLILNDIALPKEMMTEYKSLCFKVKDLIDDKKIVRYADTPLSIKYLLDNYVDAFELIDNNEAVDKNTVPKLFGEEDYKLLFLHLK